MDMFRARNGWRDLLKKHTTDLMQELKNNDPQSSTVDPSQLLKIINRRVTVPHSLRENREMLFDYMQGFID